MLAGSSQHGSGGNKQGCSGAGTWWNAVPANILEPERRSGKSLATGGTLTVKRSSKSRRTR